MSDLKISIIGTGRMGREIESLAPKRKIEVLDRIRELAFLVNPVGNLLPGDYVINISATINGQKFSENTILTITK